MGNFIPTTNMDYQLITESANLEKFLARIAIDDVIAIDTEFMRKKTFFAELCLVQIASKNGVAIIDVLSPSLSNLSPLWNFLNNEKPMKIIHAGSQDIEIIYHLTKKIPPNIIDSQLAAAVLGFGDNIGYQKLVEILLKKNIDKTMQFINWYNRPLPKKALEYAALDVIYLLEIYQKIEKILVEKNRLAWLEEEMIKLLDIKSYELNTSNAWNRLKKLPKDAKKLYAVQLLATWREEEAIKKNLPRGFIMRDELLINLCNHLPTKLDDLKTMRDTKNIIQNKHTTTAVFAIMKKAIASHNGESYQEKKPSAKISENTLIALKLLLKTIAHEKNVVARIIARESDLVDFLLKKPEARILQDWRYDIFGKHAKKLLQGELAFKLKNGEIEFIDLS
ncbi:MAG: ribonuclease D [Alphaproteobacteria bacterium]